MGYIGEWASNVLPRDYVIALVGGAGGALAVKIIDVIYSEFKRRSEHKESAANVVEKNLDPILKAADDLVGKLFSLQRSDFKSLSLSKSPSNINDEVELTSLFYYFANFWARIQILRQESIYVNLNGTKEGKQLQKFIRTLESRRVRLLDKALQRAIGDSIVIKTGGQTATLTYYEFVENYKHVDRLAYWFDPLYSVFANIHKINILQRILIYVTIIHALLDTLDTKHLYSPKRPAWPNKLTSKNRRELKFRIFGLYLTFVKTPQKYFEP